MQTGTTRYGRNLNIDPRGESGKWIFLIFLAAGLILLTIAAFLAVRHADKLKSYVKTKAVIVSLEKERMGDEESRKTVVEYLVEGSPRQATVGVYSATFSVGDELPAAYDPENPEDVILLGFWGWLGSMICGFIGMVFTLIGGITLYLFRLRPRMQERKAAAQQDKPAPWEQ